MKKGDLSLNTIVVAAIVLIVLVVIIVIFANRIGGFSKGLQDCTNKGGTGVNCVSDTQTCCSAGTVEIFKYKSDSSYTTEDKACCLPLDK
jgi:hypothetical protein